MNDYGRILAALPPEIVARSYTDPIIHAAIHQYLHGTDDLTTFLVKLVLALANARDQSQAALLERIQNGPAPLVIIRDERR